MVETGCCCNSKYYCNAELNYRLIGGVAVCKPQHGLLHRSYIGEFPMRCLYLSHPINSTLCLPIMLYGFELWSLTNN